MLAQDAGERNGRFGAAVVFQRDLHWRVAGLPVGPDEDVGNSDPRLGRQSHVLREPAHVECDRVVAALPQGRTGTEHADGDEVFAGTQLSAHVELKR